MGSERKMFEAEKEDRRAPLLFSFTAEGIESVEIVQVMPIVSAVAENTVDLTVTCQGR